MMIEEDEMREEKGMRKDANANNSHHSLSHDIEPITFSRKQQVPRLGILPLALHVLGETITGTRTLGVDGLTCDHQFSLFTQLSIHAWLLSWN